MPTRNSAVGASVCPNVEPLYSPIFTPSPNHPTLPPEPALQRTCWTNETHWPTTTGPRRMRPMFAPPTVDERLIELVQYGLLLSAGFRVALRFAPGPFAEVELYRKPPVPRKNSR